MLDLAISNHRSRPVAVCDISIKLPWEDPQFYWLEDPHQSVPAREEYVFSRDLTYPRTMVLNHRILEYGRIPGYGVISGLLLGRSFSSIPKTFKHGSEARATITIVDSTGCEYELVSLLYVERIAILSRGSRKQRFRGLFEPGTPQAEENPRGEMVDCEPLLNDDVLPQAGSAEGGQRRPSTLSPSRHQVLMVSRRPRST